jgi:hypothetical protein
MFQYHFACFKVFCEPINNVNLTHKQSQTTPTAEPPPPRRQQSHNNKLLSNPEHYLNKPFKYAQ